MHLFTAPPGVLVGGVGAEPGHRLCLQALCVAEWLTMPLGIGAVASHLAGTQEGGIHARRPFRGLCGCPVPAFGGGPEALW